MLRAAVDSDRQVEQRPSRWGLWLRAAGLAATLLASLRDVRLLVAVAIVLGALAVQLIVAAVCTQALRRQAAADKS